MSVTQSDIDRAVAIVARHGATRVLLFGRAAESGETARDLDLACEGIEPSEFLRVLGDLLDNLPVLVDLVDLSDENPLTSYIRKRGKVIYERGGTQGSSSG